MATTTNFALETPTPGGYRNTWGGTVNTTITKIDELVALALPLGTIQMYPLATAPVATTNGGTWLLCNGASLARATYTTLFALIGTTYGNVDGDTFNLPDFRARSPLGYNTTGGLTGRSTRALALGSGVETHTLLDAEIPKHLHAITDPSHLHATDEDTHIHSGTTANASTGITDSGHTHSIGSKVSQWSGGGDYGQHGTEIGNAESPDRTSSDSATISDPQHGHSFDTGATATGLTIEGANTGITATQETGVGDGAHENMHPYLVINYIILAKHPTF